MLAGGIQGIVFAMIVLSKEKYKNTSNYFLAAFIATFSLTMFQYYLSDTHLADREWMYHYIYIPFPSVNPVLFYLYVFTVLFPKKKIGTARLLLFLPFVLFFSTFLILRLMLFVIEEPLLSSAKNLLMKIFLLQEYFSIFYTVCLLIAALILIFYYNKKNLHFTRLQFEWLRLTTIVFLTFLCSAWIYLSYLDYIGKNPKFYLLWIGMSVTIYWLGYIGINKFGINEERKKIREFTSHISAETPDIQNGTKKSKQLEFFEKYIVEEKNFLDPLLSLERTAEHLGINKSYLSRILNQELNISFNDYINELRVEEAKKIMQQPEFENYTLSAVGLEAGFNSKSTFYNAFKKFAACSPSEYKSQTNKIKTVR